VPAQSSAVSGEATRDTRSAWYDVMTPERQASSISFRSVTCSVVRMSAAASRGASPVRRSSQSPKLACPRAPYQPRDWKSASSRARCQSIERRQRTRTCTCASRSPRSLLASAGQAMSGSPPVTPVRRSTARCTFASFLASARIFRRIALVIGGLHEPA
jgi:hypothetical protein